MRFLCTPFFLPLFIKAVRFLTSLYGVTPEETWFPCHSLTSFVSALAVCYLYRCATILYSPNLHYIARARAFTCVRVRYLCRFLNFNARLFVIFSILFLFARYALILYVKEHIVYMLKNILLTIALLLKTPVLCTIKHKRYRIMKAIVLKDSTFNRVNARLRAHGSDVYFSSLPSRVSHDIGFTYLYFSSFLDLCTVSDYLYACNAVHRVTEISL